MIHTPAQHALPYRPEIDGLRALAVSAVVLFHAGLPVPGGFVGVDVFFVISGYLIASVILRDLDHGRFRLLEFWERRVRRLLPAALAMVAALLVAGAGLLSSFDYHNLGRSIVAYVLLASNVYFLWTVDYFNPQAEQQPLLHTWSLSVEEQFYLVFPLLLLALGAGRYRRRLIVISAVAVTSLVLCAMWTPGLQSRAFYTMPSRAWELCIGVLVAVVPASRLPTRAWLRELLLSLGLLAILLPMMTYSAQTPFPGLAALCPTLGTAAVLVACHREGDLPLPSLARPLAWRPVVFLGLISYSLYLWHWPILAFVKYWSFGEVPFAARAMLVLGSVAVATISWRYVETPVRTKRLCPSTAGLWRWAAAGLLLTSGVAGGIVLLRGVPQRIPAVLVPADDAFTESRQAGHIVPRVTVPEAQAGRIPVVGNDGIPPRVLVWGDSHALAILPAVVAAAEGRGVRVAGAWWQSTPPLLDAPPRASAAALGGTHHDWVAGILRYATTSGISDVLLAARWSSYVPGARADSDVGTRWARAMDSTIRVLTGAGLRVWILREVPNHAAHVPKALMRAKTLGLDLVPLQRTPAQHAVSTRWFEKHEDAWTAAGARVIDVAPRLLDASASRYLMESGEQVLYRDDHHLSRQAAGRLAPAFAPLFRGRD